MIRIKRDRCGYSGYECIGDAMALPAAFADTVQVCDESDGRTSFDGPGAGLLDNYLNIPSAVAGMTMKEVGVVDLKNIGITAPEEDCLTGFQVFTGDREARPAALLDRYSLLAASGEPGLVAHRRVSVSNIFDVSDSACMQDRMLCFGEGMLSPALLEPMLAVDLPNIGLSGLPGVELALDGIMLSLTMLTAWRLEITERVNHLAGVAAHMSAMRSLINAWMQDTTCDCFRITLSSGRALSWSSSPVAPHYSVAGCTVKVNGVDVNCSGTSFTGPSGDGNEVNVYLKLEVDGRDVSASLVTRSSAPSGDDDTVYMHIGGVTCVEASGASGLRYTLWRIAQTTCSADVELIRPSGGNGVVFRARTRHADGSSAATGSGKAGIYEALDTSVCP